MVRTKYSCLLFFFNDLIGCFRLYAEMMTNAVRQQKLTLFNLVNRLKGDISRDLQCTNT